MKCSLEQGKTKVRRGRGEVPLRSPVVGMSVASARQSGASVRQWAASALRFPKEARSRRGSISQARRACYVFVYKLVLVPLPSWFGYLGGVKRWRENAPGFA